ncbi:MAG: 3-phosphoshikimate 1-carboxyvinyltransferase [Actinomycetota bacterium]
MTSPVALARAAGPLRARVVVPGSKSIANRALVAAVLAPAGSELRGVPAGDDVDAMRTCLGALGARIVESRGADGAALRIERGVDLDDGAVATLDARLAGTTSRFVTALAALRLGTTIVDGAAPLRRRPARDLHDALASLGAQVRRTGAGDLPVEVRRGGLAVHGAAASRVRVAGGASSQYASALLLVGAALEAGLEVEVTGDAVSGDYVALTAAVLEAFGARCAREGARWQVRGPLRAARLTVEPDASSATFAWCAAAVAGGRVDVAGLGRGSAQSDVRIVDVLARMGCSVHEDAGLGVSRDPASRLVGVDVDLGATSDAVPAIAATAAYATGATRIRGVAHVRAKESDRIADVVAMLRAVGADADATDDGLIVRPAPGAPRAGVVATRDDHRLAMAAGVLATASDGIAVDDVEVVSKSWPAHWAARAAWLATAGGRAG